MIGRKSGLIRREGKGEREGQTEGKGARKQRTVRKKTQKVINLGKLIHIFEVEDTSSYMSQGIMYIECLG